MIRGICLHGKCASCEDCTGKQNQAIFNFLLPLKKKKIKLRVFFVCFLLSTHVIHPTAQQVSVTHPGEEEKQTRSFTLKRPQLFTLLISAAPLSRRVPPLARLLPFEAAFATGY